MPDLALKILFWLSVALFIVCFASLGFKERSFKQQQLELLREIRDTVVEIRDAHR